MRLLTHNSLKCNKKGLSKGYPLQLQVDEMKVTESEYNEEFIKSTLDSLDWEGVLVAANAIGFQGMPAELPVDQINNEEFLRACHKLLLDVHIVRGVMTCPESGTTFPIENGIPDMMRLEEADV